MQTTPGKRTGWAIFFFFFFSKEAKEFEKKKENDTEKLTLPETKTIKNETEDLARTNKHAKTRLINQESSVGRVINAITHIGRWKCCYR